ncbi:MAG: hypothetical protein QG567_1594 [Campylobacterota bacterium]|nr:hypothetical protein [Campylobacterota bacterium]
MKNNINMSNIEDYLCMFASKNDIFNDIGWVEPIFITMVRAYQNNKNIDIFTDSGYLKNMIKRDYKQNKTYTPIEKVHNRNGLDKISSHLAEIMSKNFTKLSSDDTKDLKDYLQYLFIELMNNVADHAHSEVGGYVMAQYYPINKKIQFAVADRGVGFLSNLKLKFSVETEEEAIYKALEKGVTATLQKMYGHEKNAGFGLYAMFEILKMTGGRFVIISNDTLLRYENGSLQSKKLDNHWRGVVVAFEFDEANINYDMDHFKRNYLWSEIINDEDEDYF